MNWWGTVASMTPDLPLTGSTAPGSADEVDAYLTARESAYPDIRPGLAKEVVWANPASRQKTPLAIVYIHGFSASKGEVRPSPIWLPGRSVPTCSTRA